MSLGHMHVDTPAGHPSMPPPDSCLLMLSCLTEEKKPEGSGSKLRTEIPGSQVIRACSRRGAWLPDPADSSPSGKGAAEEGPKWGPGFKEGNAEGLRYLEIATCVFTHHWVISSQSSGWHLLYTLKYLLNEWASRAYPIGSSTGRGSGEKRVQGREVFTGIKCWKCAV